MKRFDKSKIMKRAWYLRRVFKMDMSEALRLAWQKAKLEAGIERSDEEKLFLLRMIDCPTLSEQMEICELERRISAKAA